MKRILKMLFSFFLFFGCSCLLGNYLLTEIRILPEAPQLEVTHREKIVQYKVLRLEPREYYTIHLATYEDLMACQQMIDKLAQAGYRPFVESQLPYKIKLGCFATELTLEELPVAIRQLGLDVYVEKNIYNQQSLKFKIDDIFAQEQLAPLIAGYDVLFQHSLAMFQNISSDAYSVEFWQEMIEQLSAEGDELSRYLVEVLVQAKDYPEMLGKLSDLQRITENYLKSLEKLAAKPDDWLVLLSQSYLLELLAKYEEIIKVVIE